MAKEKTSKYKCVSWCEKDQAWRVHVFYNGRQRNVGNFQTEEAAADWVEKFNWIVNPENPIEDLDGEEWREIELNNQIYLISNKGRMVSTNYRNTGRKKILKQSLNPFGYYTVSLKGRTFFVHKLMAIAFWGEQDLKVNHKDGNKTNNDIDNLEWISNRANVCHGLINSEKKELPLGAHLRKRDGRYVTEIKVDNKRIWLGSYETAEEAGARYLLALKEYGLDDDYDYINGLLNA